MFEDVSTPFPTAILWGRLGPYNWYHHLYEDYQQILRIRKEMEYLNYSHVSDHQIIFVDSGHDNFLDTYQWTFKRKPTHLNDLTPMYPRGIRIPYLIVGSESECGHQYHCLHQSGSEPVLQFRDMLYSTLGLINHLALNEVPDHIVVQVIQRKMTERRYLELDSIKHQLKHQIAISAMEGKSYLYQAKLFSEHAVYFMMHGGAIGNWIFLNSGAVVIETRTPFFNHPLTDWMMENMCSLNITIISFYFNYSDAVPNMRVIRALKEWDELPANEKTDLEKHSICHRPICLHWLFLRSSYKVSPSILNDLFDMAVARVKTPDRKCAHHSYRRDSKGKLALITDMHSYFDEAFVK
jgi:hypothetical protein